MTELSEIIDKLAASGALPLALLLAGFVVFVIAIIAIIALMKNPSFRQRKTKGDQVTETETRTN